MNNILTEVSEYVFELLNNLPQEYFYHNLQHTIEVTEAAIDIGKQSGLNEKELEILQIAAWFHDTGFIEVYENHEEISVSIAEKFLRSKGYPEMDISRVSQLIRITEPSLNPLGLLEKVLKDADVLNIGTNDFFIKSVLLKNERDLLNNSSLNEKEWADLTYKFITETDFYTEYARKIFGEMRKHNIKQLEEMHGS